MTEQTRPEPEVRMILGNMIMSKWIHEIGTMIKSVHVLKTNRFRAKKNGKKVVIFQNYHQNIQIKAAYRKGHLGYIRKVLNQ